MTFKVTQISDTHLSLDHPARTDDLRACIEVINQQGRLPDLVVHTGDVTHNGSPEEYAVAAELFEQLPCPVYAIPGNRDKRENFRQCFAAAGFLQPDNDFLQYTVDTPGYRLVFLDTLCNDSNKGEFCGERLDQLKTMLDKDAGVRRIIVFMHHAPFEAHEIPDPRQFVDWSEVMAFGKVICEHHAIERIICGHVHRNIEAVVSADIVGADSAGQSVPVHALTCLAGDLRKGQVSDSERKQPVFREFLLGD